MGLTTQSTGKAAKDSGIYIKKKAIGDKVIALAGNPNVGKSTVFNGLTGLRQHTGNWTGKTVTSAVGETTHNGTRYILVDLPGCYSLSANSAEEEVARDFIESQKADAVIIVCDGTSLERNLIFVLEILSLTEKAVVCVNLLDEAGKKHIRINLEKLETLLGVPVVGTTARQKTGLSDLLEAVEGLENRAMETVQFGENLTEEAEKICQAVVQMPKKDPMKRDRILDKIISGRALAFPVMLLLLMGVFWLTIRGANYPSAMLSRLFARIEGILRQSLSAASPWLSGIVCDGIWRVTATVVSVMLPPMAIFFPLFTLLEDAGFLPRIAFNLDRCFQKCRACGKQALTMWVAFFCVQMNFYSKNPRPCAYTEFEVMDICLQNQTMYISLGYEGKPSTSSQTF